MVRLNIGFDEIVAVNVFFKRKFGIGVRGRGGKNVPLVHYEPIKVVINLMSKNGSGSFGYEFFYALGNYFGRKEKFTETLMLT